MNDPMRHTARLLVKDLGGAIQEAKDIDRKTVEDIARRYANYPSGVLAGIVGAVIGTSGGFAISLVEGITVAASGPAGMILGAALGILLWRSGRIKRATGNLRTVTQELDSQIASLPKNAPNVIREGLYRARQRIVDVYSDVASAALSDDNGDVGGNPQVPRSVDPQP